MQSYTFALFCTSETLKTESGICKKGRVELFFIYIMVLANAFFCNFAS